MRYLYIYQRALLLYAIGPGEQQELVPAGLGLLEQRVTGSSPLIQPIEHHQRRRLLELLADLVPQTLILLILILPRKAVIGNGSRQGRFPT